MGSFRGHVVPGIAVIFLGVWHTINTIRSYHLKGPSKFVSRFWYPFNTSLLILKNLELILILAFSLSAIIILVLQFPFLNHDFKLIIFEHGTIFLHSAIYAGFALFSESPGLEKIMATSALAQELFLLRFHSSDHVGLEGHYHGLLQIIVVISLFAAIATNVVPTSFPVALVLSISYLFQGCWFVSSPRLLYAVT